MHSRIYLIGFMGSGKTTSGKQIARMLGYEFIDLDKWIEDQENMSVPKIFELHGEPHFRKLETAALHSLSSKKNVVISTGGGTPCFNDNISLLNKIGLTVYLQLSPAALLSRLSQSKSKRPLLDGKSKELMMGTINDMLADREPYYTQAAMIIDGLDRVNERVVNAIQRKQA